MAIPLNMKRIILGGILGGLIWNIWSLIINVGFLGKYYQAEQSMGHLLAQPRYDFFIGAWIVLVFVLGIGLAWIYAAARNALGPGPGTALRVGLVVGLISSLPGNFAASAWSPVRRLVPFGWLLDYLIGIILATLVAGWFYRGTEVESQSP